METVARRLTDNSTWTYLGGDAEAKEAPECVLRAFEASATLAAGDTDQQPDETTAIEVPPGEGRRLAGRHFFARPTPPVTSCLIAVRGV